MSQEEKSGDWVRGYPKKVENVTWINHAQYPRERKWPLAFWDGCDHEGNFYVKEQRRRPDPEKPIGWHGIEDPYFSVIIRSAEDWRPETFNQVRKAMVYIHRDVNVYNRRIKRITEAPWEFRRSIWSIYLGDPSRKKAIDITDEVVAAMIEALPKLKHVRIDGAPRVSDLTLSALLKCDNIRTITLTTTPDRPNILKRKTLEQAPWPPKLVYLELSGQKLPASIIEYFEYWTSKKRSAEPGESLEIVYNFGPYYIFWRDGFPRWCKDWPFQREGAWHRKTDWVLGLEPDEEPDEESGEVSGEVSDGASDEKTDEGFYETSD